MRVITNRRLLDEVDAALDDDNIVRFGQVLAEFASQTQFIVITHNPGTMELADAIYGVSMADDGVSQVVSRRLPRHEQPVAATA